MYFDEKIDIHHIFPQKWCKANDIDAKRCDSVVNKTPISARTNRMIGGNAPSVYLSRVQKSAGTDAGRMHEILRSHLIDPVPLGADDFHSFFETRSHALLERIERAMGKAISRALVDAEESSETVEYEDEGEDAA